MYVNAGNPSPDYEGTARRGMNLFTNSILALGLDTGKLAWYFQTIHHDLWDWDLVTGPMLFDVNVGGRTVKGVATAGKNCFLYVFHRETESRSIRLSRPRCARPPTCQASRSGRRSRTRIRRRASR